LFVIWELGTSSLSQVVLPKFKLESTHQLNEPLATLGLRRAFSDDAQFNGIATAPLKISEVIQKAFIEVGLLPLFCNVLLLLGFWCFPKYKNLIKNTVPYYNSSPEK
jgi:hypothetical protein